MRHLVFLPMLAVAAVYAYRWYDEHCRFHYPDPAPREDERITPNPDYRRDDR